MADLVVVTFQSSDEARRAMHDIRQLERDGGIALEDLEMIECDANGKIRHVGDVDRSTKAGAVGGGFLGLLIGLVFFPVAGLALGAIAGGLIGKSLGRNIDKQLVKDVTADLTPGSSALFILASGSAAALSGLFGKYQGKLYLATVDAELEQQLRSQLGDQS